MIIRRSVPLTPFMKKDSSLFVDIKYTLAVLALMFLAGSLPTVQAAVRDAAMTDTDPVAYTGAALFSFFGIGEQHSDSQHIVLSTSSMPLHPRDGDHMASSSGPRQGQGDMNGQEKGPKISPQDVVTLLFKNGIISSDNLDKARQLVASLQQNKQDGHMGSSTPSMMHDDNRGVGMFFGQNGQGSSTPRMPGFPGQRGGDRGSSGPSDR